MTIAVAVLHAEARERLGRDLTAGEEHVDIERLDRLLEEGKAELFRAIEAEKARAIDAYLDHGDATMDVTDRMLRALDRIARDGAAIALDELRSMGIRPREPPEEPTLLFADESRRRRRMIRRVGKATSFTLGDDLLALLSNISGRVIRDVDDLIALDPLAPDSLIAREAERRVPGSLDAASRLVSTAAYTGLGSIYEEHADLFSGWVYSAMMDGATCDVCRSYDGTRYDTWAEAMIDLPGGGPNPLCYGDGRCRCRIVPEPPEPEPGPPPVELAANAREAITDGGSAFTNPGTRVATREGLAAIDAVHRFPTGLVKIPMRGIQLRRGTTGNIRYRAGTPYEINISSRPGSTGGSLTVAHEIGHYIDRVVLGESRVQHATGHMVMGVPNGPELVAWARAVTGTRLVGWMRDDQQRGGATYGAAHGEYLLRPQELFARSYAQWIALRSGDETMRRQVEARSAGRSLAPDQWEPDDFAPVAEALDELFAAAGLRARDG